MPEEKYLANNNNLKELQASGYEIVDGEPDIRGWKVSTQTHEIGKVDELLFDIMSQKVRYLVVDIDGKPLNLLSRDVLIPIGLAKLDEKQNLVLFPEVTVGHLASLPTYKKGKVTMEVERAIRAVFVPADNGGISAATYGDQVFDDDPDEFYNHEHFNEERMYRSRRPSPDNEVTRKDDSEFTDRRKRIIPSTGQKKDNEEREVEARNAGDKPLQEGSFAPFQEGIIEIKEHSEVPYVSKETRVVEEIALNKKVEEHKEKVKDSIRKTEVDVEKISKDDLRDE